MNTTTASAGAASALQPGVPVSPSQSKSRSRRVDAEGCCAPCRARARRRSAPRRRKDPDELGSFIAHAIRLVARDADAVAEPSDVLAVLVDLSHTLDAELRRAVRALRDHPDPYSWEQIGSQLGVSKQAAQKRFGGEHT